MPELAHLVETLFTLRGYAPAPAGGHVLRFTRHQQSVAVRVRTTREPLGAGTAQEVADTLPALGHAVFVCLGDVGHEARLILERAGIDVWTRDKLIHEVGRTYLEAAEHGVLAAAAPAEPALVPATAEPPALPTATAPEPPTAHVVPALLPPPAEPAPAAPSPAPSAPVAAPPGLSLWARPPEPARAPAPPAPPRPPAPDLPAIPLTPALVQVAAPPAPAAAPPTPGEAILASTLDRDAAMKVGVGRLLKVDRATLELVPLHAFRYACRLETKGAAPVPKQGLLVVDGVSGAVREWPEPAFGAQAERGDRLQALVPEPDASSLAKRKVMELHTQKVRVRSSLGRNSLIVEDRWVRPDPRSIDLDPRGLWWLPVWRLEGQNGTLRVNGATGAVEEEKLKRAFAADAEFL